MPETNEAPSDEELSALISDVRYEVTQFRFSAARSSQLVDELVRLQRDRNAHVESMLIHARCLVDFFKNQPRKDDVVASHYVPDWDPEPHGGEPLSWLETNLGKYIDKRVAHLTAYRQRVPIADEAQFTHEVVSKMEDVISAFNRRLDPNLREAFLIAIAEGNGPNERSRSSQ